MEPEKQEIHLNKLVSYFLKNGFPHVADSRHYRIKELSKAKSFDFQKCIDHKNKTIHQTMHGLSFCWSYHPHYVSITCNKSMTVKDVFEDKEKLKKLMKMTVRMGAVKFSEARIRKHSKILNGVQCVSNFRPTAAAAIYKILVPDKGGTVFDMCCGFGGRLVGSYLAGVNYLGVDPASLTFEGNQKMIDDFNFKAEIKKQGSEITTEGWIPDDSVDACFTSPPYFNCEKYSNEKTQSYIKFPTKQQWVNEFIFLTIQNCKRITKKNGLIALNIANVKSYKTLVEDVVDVCKRNGLQLTDEWKLQLSKQGKGDKHEPIFIFKNRK